MRVAVTGAHGYVGSRITAAIDGSGADAIGIGHAELALGGAVDTSLFAHVDAVVHAAWDFGARSNTEIRRVNVAGSIRILDAARAAGVERLVFISTLSAFPGCRSAYGRAKLAVENHVRSLGGTVVRPGLVWGNPGGSLYASLVRVARRAKVVPVFTGERQKLHLVHEDDVAQLVASLVLDDRTAGGTVAAASAQPLSLGALLRRIASANGRNLHVVRVPWRSVWGVLRALEIAGLRPAFRSDSVVSLVSLDQDPFGPAGAPPGFRPFNL